MLFCAKLLQTCCKIQCLFLRVAISIFELVNGNNWSCQGSKVDRVNEPLRFPAVHKNLRETKKPLPKGKESIFHWSQPMRILLPKPRLFPSGQSRTQSLRSPWPAVGKRELWVRPFQTCAIDADCAVNRMGRIRLFPLLFQNGCSQSSRFLTAGQGERRLWERDGPVVRLEPRPQYAEEIWKR